MFEIDVKILSCSMKILSKQLRVLTSQIPNSGKGLFTTVNIQKGQLILEYQGKHVTREEMLQKDSSNVNLYVYNDIIIDATGYLASRINDANGIVKQQGCHNNCKFVEFPNVTKIFIMATRDIRSGEELFLDYGPNYWLVMVENIISGFI